MKKLLFILAIVLTSCSVDDSLEQELFEETQIENYSQALLGTWIDTTEDERDLIFSNDVIIYETNGTQEGPYNYVLDGDMLKVYHDNITVTKQIKFSNQGQTLEYIGKIYNKQ